MISSKKIMTSSSSSMSSMSSLIFLCTGNDDSSTTSVFQQEQEFWTPPHVEKEEGFNRTSCMFPVCGEDRGTTTTPVVVLVVDPVDSPSSNFEKFLRNFQNCEDGSTRSTPREKVRLVLVRTRLTVCLRVAVLAGPATHPSGSLPRATSRTKPHYFLCSILCNGDTIRKSLISSKVLCF